MTFYNMFKQPYLDAPDDLGGGSDPIPPTDPIPPASDPVPPNTDPPIEQPKIKVKYNHQEMELPYDEAVTHIQKGMNYDKAVERAGQETLDKFIVEQYGESHGIKTYAEYQEALRQQEMKDKGVDPETVKKYVEEHPDVKAAREYRQNQEKEAKQKAEFVEFFGEFPDVDAAKIPPEVWAENAKGKPLADAYARYLLKSQRDEEAKAKANKANADSSMGSVSTNGNTDPGHISFEDFEKNRGNQEWVNKNYKKIMDSRAKW
jgi:hypothetical protein